MTAAQLKASILDLAIRGQLVPQDPNDEPVEVLLERIKTGLTGFTGLRENSRVEVEKWRENRASGSGAEPQIYTSTLLHGKKKNPVNPVNPVKKYPPVTDEEKPFDLPAGWTWCRLGDVVISPITYGIIKLGKEDSDGVKVLRSSDVKAGYIQEESIRTVEKKLSDEYKRTILHGGEIVVNVRGTLGGCALIPERFAGYNVAREVAVINRTSQIDGWYLMWCLISDYFWRYMASNLKGIAYKGLNIGLLTLFPIPLPPLAEQHRIVAKIEELMPLVKRYEAAEQKRVRLDAALPEALKKSILKAAFDGAMLEGCAFEEKPLSAACADIFTGNSLSEAEKRTFTRPDGLPFIGTKDVGFDQVVDYENGIRIPERATYRTAPAGATVLCIEGGSSGRKIGLLDRAVRFGNKLCAFAPGKGLDSRYLFLYLQSPQFLEQFTALQNGPRKGAGISQIKALTIRVTDMQTQRFIVARIEEYLSQIDKIDCWRG